MNRTITVDENGNIFARCPHDVVRKEETTEDEYGVRLTIGCCPLCSGKASLSTDRQLCVWNNVVSAIIEKLFPGPEDEEPIIAHVPYAHDVTVRMELDNLPGPSDYVQEVLDSIAIVDTQKDFQNGGFSPMAFLFSPGRTPLVRTLGSRPLPCIADALEGGKFTAAVLISEVWISQTPGAKPSQQEDRASAIWTQAFEMRDGKITTVYQKTVPLYSEVN